MDTLEADGIEVEDDIESSNGEFDPIYYDSGGEQDASLDDYKLEDVADSDKDTNEEAQDLSSRINQLKSSHKFKILMVDLWIH